MWPVRHNVNFIKKQINSYNLTRFWSSPNIFELTKPLFLYKIIVIATYLLDGLQNIV